MGIKEWLTPQISEHWPKKIPPRLKLRHLTLKRPGMASILTPREGTVQEWITSEEVQVIKSGVLKGKINRLSTSNNRILELSEGNM